MDWAVISKTITRFETLVPEEAADELDRLREDNPELFGEITGLHAASSLLASFMMTRMPQETARFEPSLSPGDRLDAWEIGELLGAGGMGKVYKARRADGHFEQEVALKLARSSSEGFRVRCEAERQRLAQLEHPNIARIVDGGTSPEGAIYMTLEFVDGETIEAHVKNQSLDRAQRLGLILSLCSALTYAHGKLVLHKDIKHGNVLINKAGEVRLIDFGIASLLDDREAPKGRGPLTIAYAAPEQLEERPVSAATDIFAVGMLAHLLETGDLPERNSDGSVTIDARALADADLAAILKKATAADPAKRYGSVDALNDDLEKYLGGFPVAARPVATITRFKKLVARNKFASAMSALAVAAMVAGVIGVSVFALRASKEAEAARIAQQQGGNTVTLYETYNAGFNAFISSIDPQSPQGQSIFSALEALEAAAQDSEKSDPQRSLEINVFLAELYADIGRDQDASRVGERLGQNALELTYPVAFTLSGLVGLSRGYVEDSDLIKTLDRLNGFFSKDPKIYSFDIAMNRCVRQRITNSDQDAKVCLDSATKHLEQIDLRNYAEASGNLPLFAYAADAAIHLQDFERATKAASSGLKFYENETRPGSVPEASFWALLSDVAQAQMDWSASEKHLWAARKSLGGNSQFMWMEVDISMQMAETQIALRQFANAEASARLAHDQAMQVYGPDHFQVRNATAYIAMALAGNGDKGNARKMLQDLLNAEAQSMNDPKAQQKYTGMLVQISAM